MIKIAVLSSSEGLQFQSLIEAKKSGKLKAELCCLVTDKADCGAAQKARAASIRVYYFDAREVDSSVYEEQVVATLDYFKADLVVLDGFGRPVSSAFSEKFEDRLVNVDTKESAEKFVQKLMDDKILV
jgi:phosphoribosylglycinamide formyltransferase 1